MKASPPSACSIALVIRLYYVSFNIRRLCWVNVGNTSLKSHTITHTREGVFWSIFTEVTSTHSLSYSLCISVLLCVFDKNKIKKEETQLKSQRCKLSPILQNNFWKDWITRTKIRALARVQMTQAHSFSSSVLLVSWSIGLWSDKEVTKLKEIKVGWRWDAWEEC